MSKAGGLAILLVVALMGIAGASSLSPLTVAANTVYQNSNAVCPLVIYGIENGGDLSGFIGPANTGLTQVSNSTISLSGVVGATLNFKSSQSLTVPPEWYYLFNYTSNSVFNGLYSTPCGGAQTLLIGLPNVKAPQFSPAAMLLYAAGLAMFLLLILMVFSIIKPWNLYGTLIGGLIGLLIAFMSIILIASGLAYTATYSAASHTVNAPNALMTVGQQTIATQPMADNIIFTDFGDLAMTVDAIVGLAYLALSLVVFKKARDTKKYGMK